MLRTLISSFFLLLATINFLACTDNTQRTESINARITTGRGTDFNTHKTQITPPTLDQDTTVFINFNNHPIEIIIKFPVDTIFKGAIVALPGWNYSNSDWCEKTELCEKALSDGYAVILPEMGKSIYCDSVFPETRKDWLKYPTRSWIKEIMVPFIQTNFKLLATDQNNYVMGLSTGARGAVLLALDLPEIFSACGALSGDFDQTRYTKDKLYYGYYGSFDQFTDRWLNNDNAITSIQRLTVPVYIGHGEQDAIVPLAYSQQLYDELQKIGNTQSVIKVNPTAGHSYEFWNSEVDAVLDYFKKFSS